MSWDHARPSSPTRRSAGTKQSVKKTSLTSRAPIVSIGRTSRPSAPRGHREHRQARRALTPPGWCGRRAGCARSVGAGDPGLLAVDHIAASTRSARQDRLPTSEPASGSDIAIASTRPPTIPPRSSCLSASEPKRSTGRGGHHADREEPHRDLPAAELLAQHAQLRRPPARAAIGLGNRRPEPAQLGDLRVELGVVGLAAVVGECLALLAGAALAGGEVADRLGEGALLVGEGEKAHGCNRAARCRHVGRLL